MVSSIRSLSLIKLKGTSIEDLIRTRIIDYFSTFNVGLTFIDFDRPIDIRTILTTSFINVELTARDT
ncbi:hypothetical protein D3C74_260700 [compost metagenome]